MPATEVAGRVVNDLVHLLAELLENATSFSSPQTKVKVTGHALPDGRVLASRSTTPASGSPPRTSRRSTSGSPSLRRWTSPSPAAWVCSWIGRLSLRSRHPDPAATLRLRRYEHRAGHAARRRRARRQAAAVQAGLRSAVRRPGRSARGQRQRQRCGQRPARRSRQRPGRSRRSAGKSLGGVSAARSAPARAPGWRLPPRTARRAGRRAAASRTTAAPARTSRARARLRSARAASRPRPAGRTSRARAARRSSPRAARSRAVSSSPAAPAVSCRRPVGRTPSCPGATRSRSVPSTTSSDGAQAHRAVTRARHDRAVRPSGGSRPGPRRSTLRRTSGRPTTARVPGPPPSSPGPTSRVRGSRRTARTRSRLRRARTRRAPRSSRRPDFGVPHQPQQGEGHQLPASRGNDFGAPRPSASPAGEAPYRPALPLAAPAAGGPAAGRAPGDGRTPLYDTLETNWFHGPGQGGQRPPAEPAGRRPLRSPPVCRLRRCLSAVRTTHRSPARGGPRPTMNSYARPSGSRSPPPAGSPLPGCLAVFPAPIWFRGPHSSRITSPDLRFRARPMTGCRGRLTNLRRGIQQGRQANNNGWQTGSFDLGPTHQQER
ncbi:hypothetical protein SBADM41S_03177 [Streptomyces badius]